MSGYAIGIDLGATKVAATLIDRSGQQIAQDRFPTRASEGIAAVVGRIADCIRDLEAAAPGPVDGAGVGVAAIADIRRGVVVSGVNLGWSNVPIVRLLTEQLGPSWAGRLWIDKDCSAAALAEWLYGAGQGVRVMLYIPVGTGISVALVVGGRLYHGIRNGDGNIGHLILDPHGERCACGKPGCLETFASGPAIARRAVAALKAGEPSTLHRLDTTALTAVDVVRHAQSGDALARRVLAEAGHYLGIALAYCVDLLNPERIVVGGGVSAAGDLLLDPIRQTIAERALPSNARDVAIVLAALDDAGAIGAAALVWQDRS